MRFITPAVRSSFVHLAHAAVLLGVGVMAAAAGPVASSDADMEKVAAAPAPAPVVAMAEPAGPVLATLTFAAPVAQPVNSRFGTRHLPGEPAPRRHEGVDFAAPTGTPVVASAEGEVVRTGYEPSGYGRFIEVEHANGMRTFYAHLSRVDVRRGDRVLQGERIGRVGSTGYSTGPHLHFEVRRNGGKLNPERVMGESFTVRVETSA
ncbi:MAG: M23 family metallopeptidase [Brevundimonas sp.]